MPRFLELGLKGLFRSRWGVGLVILAVVAVVIGLSRLVGGHGSEASPVISVASPAPPVSIGPGDDDGPLPDTDPTPSPVTSPGRAQPEAVAYAFALAWADHRNVSARQWHDGIIPNATKDLSDQLNDVDPADVPADHVLGRPSLVPVSAQVVNAVVNTDAGTLTLQLIAPTGHWLVNDIDWAAS